MKVKRAISRHAESSQSQGYELVIRRDPSIYDGRFANNGWLQELPKPLSKLTWDNAIVVSPNMAKEMGFTAGPECRRRPD